MPTARPALRALAGYALVTLLLAAPSIRPGHTLVPADALTHYSPFREAAGGFDADNPIVSDAATQFFPWLHFVGGELRAGRWPAWNPLVLGGVPVSPNGYVNVAYPGTWLAAVLDPFDAYAAFVVVHLVLGALGVYALARTVGARPWPSWVAGLLVLAGGAWLHWSLHLVHLVGMIGLPWAMAAAARLVARPSARRAAALAVVLGLWWLGANPQYAYFGGLALAGWIVGLLAARVPERATPVRALAWVGAAAAAGLLLAAPTLLPSLANQGEILRRAEPAGAMVDTHLPLRHGVRLLVPDAIGNPADGFLYASGEEFAMNSPFLGVAAVVPVGVAAAVGWRRRDRMLLLLAGGAAAVLALAFLGPPHAVLRAVLPGYDRFRGSARWIAVLPAFALPLAARGLDLLAPAPSASPASVNARRQLLSAGVHRTAAWVAAGADRTAAWASAGVHRTAAWASAGVHRTAAWVAAGATGLIGLWMLREAFVASAPHAYLARRAAFAVAVLAAVAAAARRPRWVLPVVTAVALAEVAVAVPRWLPDVPKARAYPRLAALDELARAGGRFVRVGGPRDLPAYLPPDVAMAYGIADVSGLTPLFPADYDRYLRLVDDYGDTARELNVAPPLALDADVASPLLDALDVRAVVRPGARVATRPSPGGAVVVRRAVPATESAMWAAVAAPGWDPNATSAVAGLARPVEGTGGTARRSGGDSTAERWRVVAPAGGLLRVSGRFDAGWRATIDGRPTRVLRADGIFRAVVVPPGTHVVAFRYEPPAQPAALAAAAAGGVLVLLAALGGRGRQ